MYYKIIAKPALVVMTPNSDGAPVSAMETIATGVNLILPNLDYDIELFKKATFYKSNTIESLKKFIITVLNVNSDTVDTTYLKKNDRNTEMKNKTILIL